MKLLETIPSAIPPDAARVTYRVTLTDEERTHLKELTGTGKAAARALTHARILLTADEAAGRAGWPDERIAAALDVSLSTIARVRRRFVADGLDAALHRRPSRTPRATKRDGRAAAHLVALTCSTPPKGYERWTLRLLTDRFGALGVSEPVLYATVRRVRKKTSSSRGPGRNGAFHQVRVASSSARWKRCSMSTSDRMSRGSHSLRW